MELMCLICVYAVLQVLFTCCGMLRLESRVTPRVFHEGLKWNISIIDVSEKVSLRSHGRSIVSA